VPIAGTIWYPKSEIRYSISAPPKPVKPNLRLFVAAIAACLAMHPLAPVARAQVVQLEKPKNHGFFFRFALSPDGALVGGGSGVAMAIINGRKEASDGGEVILWDARTGKIRKTLGKHDASPRWFAWSADGTLLASGSVDDGVVKIWDTKSGALRATLNAGGKLAESGNGSEVLCAFSADGRTVATVMEKESELGKMHVRIGDTLTLWDVGTGKPRWQVQDSQVAVLTLSPDARTLVAYAVKVDWKLSGNDSATGAHSEQRVVAWDVPTGKETWRADAKRISPGMLAFVPGLGLLAIDGRTYTPLDVATGQPGTAIRHEAGGTPRALTFSADGKRFVASDFMGGKITWCDTSTGKATGTQQFPKRISDATFSRDLKVAVGNIGFAPSVVTLAPEPPSTASTPKPAPASKPVPPAQQ
jgi:hypothetical protein